MTSSVERCLALWKPRKGAGMPTAEIVAKVGPDGAIAPIEHERDVVVLAPAMLDAGIDTLWLVRVQEERGHALTRPPTFPPSVALPLIKHMDGPRLDYELPESFKRALPPKISMDLRANGGRGPRNGRPPGRGDAQRPNRGDASGEAPEPVRFAAEAVPCTTGLPFDAGDLDNARRILLGEGLSVELARAPDFVGLGGGLWARSNEWPIVAGRLKAPSQPARRVVEVVRMPEGQAPSAGRVLGLCILPAAILSAEVEAFEDWRTDDEVLADASQVRRVFGDDPAAAIAADLEALVERLEAGRGVRDRGDEFRLRRVIEVARRRASVPRDLASLLPGVGGLDDLLSIEKEQRWQAILDQIDSDVAAERARLTSSLEGLRSDLAEAERSLPLLRERETETRRVLREIQADVGDTIERRVAEAVSKTQPKMADIERRLELLHLRLEGVASDRADTEATLEALRGDVASILDLAAKAASAAEGAVAGAPPVVPVPSDLPPPTDEGQDRAEALVRDPVAAARGLRWQARWKGVDVAAVELGAVAAVAGMLPVFVGARANAAAVALSEALAAETFDVLDCDPALLAISDLLDPARARTEVLLRAVERARGKPDRWHAVALRSVDWAPCGYWLPSLGRRGPAATRLPANLAIVAAVASDGPRTSVPTSALASAIPILVEPWKGRGDAAPTTSPWAAELTIESDPSSVAEFESEMAIAAEGTDGEVRASMTRAALAGRRLFGWDARRAADELAILPEVAATARHGAPATERVRSLLAIMSIDGAP